MGKEIYRDEKAIKQGKGVETTIAEPYKDIEVTINEPAIVLVVID